MTGLLAKGYQCKCDVNHSFSSWVYAHWDMEICHTCSECGRINIIFQGKYWNEKKGPTKTSEPSGEVAGERGLPAAKGSLEEKIQPEERKT